MCAPSPPPAPDYVGAAQQQGQANVEASRVGARLNNPNVISPWGTQTVEWGTGFDEQGYNQAVEQYNQAQDRYQRAWNAWNRGDGEGDGLPLLGSTPVVGGLFGGGGRGPREGPFDMRRPTPVNREDFILNRDQATIRQRLSPEQQRIYDLSTQVRELLGGLGVQGATALQGIVGRNLDFSGIPAMPGNADATRQRVIDAMMNRVNQDTDIARGNLRSELIAAGIRPGSEAYDNRMHMLDRSYNDARNQAFLASGQEASRDFGLDSERRRQAITELLAQRQIPLNEITALMSGSQVSNPFAMPGFGGAQTPQASPLFAAQNAMAGYNTDVFNAESATAANQQSGAMAAGTTAIMLASMY